MRRGSRMQIGARAIARIGKPALLQTVKGLGVHRAALALKQRRAFPGETQVFEITLNGIDVFGLAAIGVRSSMRSTICPPDRLATIHATSAA